MSNNDKFIRDTPHGKLMETESIYQCLKCKYITYAYHKCKKVSDNLCMDKRGYYFAKDETEEVKDNG